MFKNSEQGPVAQSVVSPTADPGYGHSVQHYQQSIFDSTEIMHIVKKLLNSNHQVIKLLMMDPAHSNAMKQTCEIVILALLTSFKSKSGKTLI